MAKCDGVIFVLDHYVPPEGVSVWLETSLKMRHVLMVSGNKGHFLGMLGVPYILFDDKYKNLAGATRLAHPLSMCVRVDPPIENYYRGDYIYRSIYMTLNSPRAWVIQCRRFCRSIRRRGWGDRDGIIRILRERQQQHEEAEIAERVRCGWVSHWCSEK